jgi:hypothetical protein
LKNLELKEYYVREDFTSARPTKIHHKKCNFYKKYIEHKSTTVYWHGPFTKSEVKNKAIAISKNYSTGWEISRCCIREKQEFF